MHSPTVRPDFCGPLQRYAVLDQRMLAAVRGIRILPTVAWPASLEPTCYVCGPTGFVETVADILVALGHEPRRVRTERFGPSGP